MEELPVYKIKGKFYFLDKRLNEYRNTKNPVDRLNFNDVSLKDLQKPTKQDCKKVFGNEQCEIEKHAFIFIPKSKLNGGKK